VNGVVVSVCPACAWRGFPERLWCPRCGSFELDNEIASEGAVEDATTVHRAAGRPRPSPTTRLGTVRVERTVPVVARLDRAAPGDMVRLTTDAGVVIARHATCNDPG
jgi:uncharacterized OB-fold protein